MGTSAIHHLIKKHIIQKTLPLLNINHFTPNISLRGENLRKESSIGNIITLGSDQVPVPLKNSASETESTDTDTHKAPNLLIYQRRKKTTTTSHTQTSQETNEEPVSEWNDPGVPTETTEQSEEIQGTNQMDLPIAKRKGSRACTNHPIERWVSYGNLSEKYKEFVSSVDAVMIPKNGRGGYENSSLEEGSHGGNQHDAKE